MGCLSAAHASTTPAKMAATLNRTHIRSSTITNFNDGPKELIAGGLNTEKFRQLASLSTTRTGLQVRTLIVAKILGEHEQDDE
jgi:hypothetical protein